MREKLDRVVAVLLLTAALFFTSEKLMARAKPDAPREDSFAATVARLDALPPDAPYRRWLGAWLALTLAASTFVGARLVAKARRGEKLPDPLAKPPPWPLVDFLFLFAGAILVETLAVAQLPRPALVLDPSEKRFELERPVTFGGEKSDIPVKHGAGERVKVAAQEDGVHFMVHKSAPGEARVLVDDEAFLEGDRILSPGNRFDVGGVRGHFEGRTFDESLLALGAGSIASILLILGAVKLREAPLAEIGLGGFSVREAARGVVAAAALFPGVIALTALTSWICRVLSVPMTEHPLLEDLERHHDARTLALVVLVAAVLAPVKEELLFRGHLLRGLRGPIPSRVGAILASSFIFGSVHPGLSSLLPITFVGAVFGALFLTSERRSLAANMTCHATFNAVNIAFSYALVRAS